MIRLVGAIQSQQFLVFLQQFPFARRRGQRAGFLRRRNRIVIASRLGVGGRQRADEGGHAIVRQFAGAPGILDGLNAIPKVCVRTGRQQPGQIVQDLQGVGFDLQRLLILGDRFVHPALLEQGIPEVVMGFRVVGFDLQRLLEMNHRFVHLPFWSRT